MRALWRADFLMVGRARGVGFLAVADGLDASTPTGDSTLGIARSASEALDRMARDAGYSDYAEAVRVFAFAGDLIAEEVSG